MKQRMPTLLSSALLTLALIALASGAHAQTYTSGPTTTSASCPTTSTNATSTAANTCATSPTTTGNGGPTTSGRGQIGGTGGVGGEQPEGQGSPFPGAPLVVLMLGLVAAVVASRRRA